MKPLYFLIWCTIITKREKKTIIIKAQNQQKCGISLLVCIAADWSKLPPLIILKGKSGGIKKCYICVNDKSWVTDSIINYWFYNLWLKYLKNEENLCENVVTLF